MKPPLFSTCPRHLGVEAPSHAPCEIRKGVLYLATATNGLPAAHVVFGDGTGGETEGVDLGIRFLNQTGPNPKDVLKLELLV